MTDSPHPLLQAARDLAPRIAAAADQIEADRRLPADLIASLIDAGLYRMIVPSSLGGAEVPLSVFSTVIEELAQTDASTAWCVSQNSGVCRVSGWLPHDGAADIFQPRSIVSWGNGHNSAVRVPGGYRLTGRWVFGSGSRHATWVGGQEIAIIHEDGEPYLRDDGSPERLTLMFPTTDIQFEDVWQVSGLRGTGSDTYLAKDLFVPERHAALDRPQEPGPLYLFRTAHIFSIGFASVALGLARAMLNAFIDLACAKTARDMTGSLRQQAVIQVHVARSEAVIRSARAYLHEAIEDIWQEALAGHLSLDKRVHLRLATTSAIEQAASVVDIVYRMAGTTAIFDGSPFERRYRDMHAVTQHIQAREDHFEPVGQFFLGLEPSMLWI